MTKISKKLAYPLKSPIKDDYFVGSDSEVLGKTVNFSFEDATKIVNELNGTSVLNYRFKTDYNINLEVLNEGVFLSLGNVTAINSITKLYINKKNLGETDLSQLFQFIATNKEQFLIKLRNSTNPNNAVYLNITALNNFTDYFTIDVSVYLSNAAITSLVHYNTYFFEFELKAGSGSGSQGPQGEPGINGTNGTNGTNGLSAYQIAINNATFVGTEAEFAAMQATVLDKLDKGTYSGDANALDTRISQLEGSQVFYNRFTGKSYAIWSGTGLIYDVYYTSYYLEDILYPGGYVQKTLSASDPADPRFDLIKVDATGVIVATGTPSASPEVPSADPNTELAISSVLVEAGALTPVGAVNEDVYKENTEWTTFSNNGTVNFNATVVPFQGTKYIDCGAFTNGQYLRFTDSAVNQITDFSLLKFYVNLKATFSTSAKFSVKFYNGTTLVSSVLTVTSGSYNFNRTITNTYQALIIPLSSFTFSGSSFNRIEIAMVGSNTSGFRIDNIILSQGAGTSSTEQNAITSITTDSGVANATIKDDTFQFKGANGLVVSAIGKILTFTSNFTAALKTNYDSAYAWVSTNGASILSHLSNTSNPHSVTKSQIGLGNVDNTSDVNKPISTDTQTALNAKLSGTLTTNRIPKFNSSNTLVDSSIFDTGNILIGTTTDNGTDKLQVTGSIRSSIDSFVNGIRIGKGNNSLSSNTIVGLDSGASISTGIQNTFVGFLSGLSTTTGENNSFIGSNNGVFNTTGSNNSFIGGSAGYFNTIGSKNSFIGSYAGLSTTTGSNNSFIGTQAGLSNDTGSNNTFIGLNAGRTLADGATDNSNSNDSVFIGNSTKALNASDTNEIVIGQGTTGLGSNTTIIGNNSTTFSAIKGRNLVGTTTDNGVDALQVTGSVGLNTTPTTSASTYDILTRNTSTGKVEKVASSGVGSWTTTGNDIYNSNTGNIGIGTATPAYKLDVRGDMVAGVSPVYVSNFKPNYTTPSSGSYEQTVIKLRPSFNIPSGVSQNGLHIGVYSSILRDNVLDAGTLAYLHSVAAIYGHLSNVTGHTESANGVTIHPYHQGGSIGSSKALYLENASGGITPTNYWSIYQEDSLAKNYFSGRILVGTTTDNGVDALQVTGSVGLNTAPTTSTGGYDILTRNTSNGKIEKVASSGIGDMTLGTNQSFTGIKSFTVTSLGTPALNIVNPLAGTSSSYGAAISNSNDGSGLLINQTSTGQGAKINNSSTGDGLLIQQTGGGQGINIIASVGNGQKIRNLGGSFGNWVLNESSGIGGYFQNHANGTGVYVNNLAASTNTALVLNNQTGTSAKPFQYTKNSVEKAFINDAGDLSAQKIIANDVVRLKNYTVSTLPAGVQGNTAYVTDALAPTYLAVVVGGGAVVCKVFYNGTSWTVG